MRLSLRWKIMTVTVLPLVTLAFATLWVVNRNISRQVHRNIQEDLRRASAVLEDLLAAHEQSLAVAGRVIVQDPKFFSVLTIPTSSRDAQLRATVRGVALDFNAITQADLFEVANAEGRLVAAVGRDASEEPGRERLVPAALAGRPVSALLVQGDRHYQVSVTPVSAGGRVVGALLLGERIGAELADRLRRLTRSEVTFLSGATTTGTTLESEEDRRAVLASVGDVARRGSSDGAALSEIRGATHLYLTLIRPLPRSDPQQRQFYVMQRSLDAETAFLRETQGGLLSLGVATVFVALLVGFLIAERITAPVQRLVRGAEEMERGHYDFPLAVRTGDEIGELATRFEDMRRRQREYVHALREAARIKTEFLTVASHELRTPISVIRGFQELMLDGKLGVITAQQRQALEATGQGLTTLSRIAENATRMAQIEGDDLALSYDDHDAAALLDQALATVRNLGVGRRVRLVGETAPGAGRVRVDGPRLVQALVNLLSNGVRYTPDGGRVEARMRRDGPWLAVTVRDNGVGIAPEHQQHIFDRSFIVRGSLHHHSSSSLEFNSAGLGLGLAVARGIVEAHGGRLEVESTVGAGSTFTLWVPAGVPADKEVAA